MKVCFATEFYPSTALSGIVKELVRQDIEVVVFTSQHDLYGRKRVGKKTETGEETIYYTPSVYLPSIPYDISPVALRDFTHIMKNEKIDLVHAQVFAFYMIPNMTPLIKQICKLPLALTFHGLQHEAFVNLSYRVGMSAYYKSYFRFIVGQADAVITLSKYSREKAVRLGANPEKVLVLPNGVDSKIFHPSTESEIVRKTRAAIKVVYVGRISASKGVFVLLQVAKRLTENYGERISFLFAGDGPDRKALLEAFDKNGLRNAVWLGHVSNVRDLLVESDIFVLPSFYEGLPLSLMEAMACKVPVVTSSVGDIPDLVEHGHNGLLVPPYDVDSLQKAIQTLIEDPDYRRNLGRNAYDTIKKQYSLDTIASRLKELYERLLQKRSRST